MWLIALYYNPSVDQFFSIAVEIHAKATEREVRKILMKEELKCFNLLFWYVEERKPLGSKVTNVRVFTIQKDIPTGDSFIRPNLRKRDEENGKDNDTDTE